MSPRQTSTRGTRDADQSTPAPRAAGASRSGAAASKKKTTKKAAKADPAGSKKTSKKAGSKAATPRKAAPRPGAKKTSKKVAPKAATSKAASATGTRKKKVAAPPAEAAPRRAQTPQAEARLSSPAPEVAPPPPAPTRRPETLEPVLAPSAPAAQVPPAHPAPAPKPVLAPAPIPGSSAVVEVVPPQSKPPELAHLTPAGPGHDEIFDKQTSFKDLGLRGSVLRGLEEAGFKHPTAIQARLIPTILQGKDVLGQAKTGTGKTASFGLPVLNMIEKGTPFQALVLVPTRELAIQVATDLQELGRFTPLHILPVYGGQNVKTQAQKLAKGPEIIVATPGRVMDMHQRGYLHYKNTKMVVLDEVDRMLDIGFRDDIRRILSTCPRERQTIFVSATISSDIEALARSHARNAEKIVASAGSLTVSMVKQFHLPVAPWDKKQLLLHLLTHEEPTLTVVFCRTKKTVDNLTEYLSRKGIDAHAIHGDMYQGKRNTVIQKLRSGKLGVLVASDLASRGLDVEGITHVINYDLPEDPDLYVHRIGRTARAGREGIAWALVTPEQGELLTQIELLINAEIPKLDYPDFKPGPIPQDVLERKRHDADRAQAAKALNRFAATVAAPAPVTTAAAPDPVRFPGGIVPSGAPPKRMWGRVKTARSLKQAMAQPGVQAPAPAAPAPG